MILTTCWSPIKFKFKFKLQHEAASIPTALIFIIWQSWMTWEMTRVSAVDTAIQFLGHRNVSQDKMQKEAGISDCNLQIFCSSTVTSLMSICSRWRPSSFCLTAPTSIGQLYQQSLTSWIFRREYDPSTQCLVWYDILQLVNGVKQFCDIESSPSIMKRLLYVLRTRTYGVWLINVQLKVEDN